MPSRVAPRRVPPPDNAGVTSAHIDRFTAERLPPREQWPDLLLDNPELRYPDRLNCGVELLDGAIERFGGERRCLVTALAGDAAAVVEVRVAARAAGHGHGEPDEAGAPAPAPRRTGPLWDRFEEVRQASGSD